MTKKYEPKAGESKANSNSVTNSTVKRSNTVRRLSDAEITRRRELGLCFKCGDKFGPNHTCKNKQLQVLLLEEEMGKNPEETEAVVDIEEEENTVEEEGRLMALLLNSIAGFGNNHTMKLRGMMKEDSIIVLIDGGASHNFILEELVERLKIPTSTVTRYSVSVGDGHKVKRDKRCQDLTLKVQNLPITQTLYPFPLRGVDVVLGVEWLKSLGEVRVDWG